MERAYKADKKEHQGKFDAEKVRPIKDAPTTAGATPAPPIAAPPSASRYAVCCEDGGQDPGAIQAAGGGPVRLLAAPCLRS